VSATPGGDPMGAAVGPLVPIDPAEYPHRFLVTPEHPAPDASVGIIWLATPWPAQTVAVVLDTLAAGGGLFLLAKDRAELVRQRETVELLISAPGGQA
jgi:hypothetical protein